MDGRVEMGADEAPGEHYGGTAEERKAATARNLLLRKRVTAVIKPEDIPQEEVNAYYEQNPGRFQRIIDRSGRPRVDRMIRAILASEKKREERQKIIEQMTKEVEVEPVE